MFLLMQALFPFSFITGIVAAVATDLKPPILQDGKGQDLSEGQIPVGTELHLVNPNEGGQGTIYYTLDGSDPRHTDLDFSDDLVAYDDERFYRVPTSGDDGFLLAPPLSVVPIARYTFDKDGTDSAPAGGLQNVILGPGASITSNAMTTGALLLNRDNEHAIIGDPPALQITGPISVSAWAYATTLSNEDLQNILIKGPSGNPERSLFLRINHAAKQYEFGVTDENGTRLAAFPIPGEDRGAWVHLAGIHDGTQSKLYHNGILVANAPDLIGAIPISGDWTLGAQAEADGDFLYGSIDEVHIFNDAITDSDVTALYRATIPQWTALNYQPALDWSFGPGGHGYSFNQFIGTDISGEMPGVSASVYVRAEFGLSQNQIDSINHLELNTVYDDGFVAYLNGVEVHRENAPAVLHGQSKSLGPHLPEDEEVKFKLEEHVDLLLPGINVFAIHGLNNSINSDDFLIHTQLRAGTAAYSVAASATPFTVPVPIRRSTVVKARIFCKDEWGPLVTADYQTPNFAITKIHYNPKVNPANDAFPANAYEYIEIQNIDTRRISLGGLHLGGAVTCDIPSYSLAPGQRFVIPNNTDGLFNRHPEFPSTIVINFQGDLPNQPARLHLYSDTVGTIRDFEYGIGFPDWPDTTNGGGYSLVLIKPETNPDHADPANWLRSVELDGSPGESDAISFAGIASNDDDGDGLSALLEYAIGTSDTDPTPDPWSARLSDIAEDDPSERFLLVEVRRRIGTDDVVWIPEVSDDLRTWIRGPIVPGINRPSSAGPAWVTDQFRGTQPVSAQPRQFIRVRVEQR